MELTKIHAYIVFSKHIIQDSHHGVLQELTVDKLYTNELKDISNNLRGVLGRSLGGEASVSRYVEQESAVGGQLPVARGHENHELSDGRLVQEVLVRVVPLVHHRRPRPASSAAILLK